MQLATAAYVLSHVVSNIGVQQDTLCVVSQCGMRGVKLFPHLHSIDFVMYRMYITRMYIHNPTEDFAIYYWLCSWDGLLYMTSQCSVRCAAGSCMFCWWLLNNNSSDVPMQMYINASQGIYTDCVLRQNVAFLIALSANDTSHTSQMGRKLAFCEVWDSC
jgi:hypothetical protein